MIKVAQIPGIERYPTEKIINRNLKREGLLRKRVQETVRSETMIWMPYHNITYEFTIKEPKPGSNEDLIGTKKTTVNAMFGSCVEDESEILGLFRPDLLEIDLEPYNPSPKDVIGAVNEITPQQLLESLLEYRAEIGAELHEIGFELTQLHRRMQTMSFFLPTSKSTRIREETLSNRLAKLSGTKYSIQMRVGLPDNANITKVTDDGVFYSPQLLVTLEHKLSGDTRFLIIDFVRIARKIKGGYLDDSLGRLCSINEECRAVLEALITK